MNQLILKLKDSKQDYEFYPTTDEIIQDLVSYVKVINVDPRVWGKGKATSFLDIGAGNGKVLKAMRNLHIGDLYAIEKSQILCRELSGLAYIVGTDFIKQSLIDKAVDVTFCNPPYSQFELWAEKIIRETASRLVYLVIPARWEKSRKIKDAIKWREASTSVIGTYSFADAEDRKARAFVNLVQIDLRRMQKTSFDCFFSVQFKDIEDRFTEYHEEKNREGRSAKFGEIVEGKDFLSRLVAMYEGEIKHIQANYTAVGTLDVGILKEFDVSVESIKKCLCERLKGLKNTYWKELFSHMKIITDRLTRKKRDDMLQTLNANGNVDFNPDNIHAVVGWVLENANVHIDDQLLEVYDQMLSTANVKNYKSNEKVLKLNHWRYINKDGDNPTHFALEYRLVLDHVRGIEDNWGTIRMSETGGQFIADLLTVARNLGFDCDTTDLRGTGGYSSRYDWTPGKKEYFHYTDAKGKEQVLFELKAYKNGNIHMRMNQHLALALNVEYGRLRGWLSNPAEAARELGDSNASIYFGRQLRLTSSSVKMLAS